LLATFGIIAGGGRGLHFAPCFCLHRPGSTVASACHGHSHCKATNCRSRSAGNHQPQQAPTSKALLAVGTSKVETSLGELEDDHSHCLVCKFFFQGTLENSDSTPTVHQLLAAVLGTFADEFAPSRGFDSYLARGPPIC
jgi:hypothetical protein